MSQAAEAAASSEALDCGNAILDNQGRPAPGRRELDAAAERVHGQAHQTPVLTSRTLDACLGASVFFKCENLQRVGAFKFRGAFNVVASLSAEERRQGFITHSSGNHAQALSLAAQLFDAPATIVMPENAPAVKKAAVKGYGARIVECAPTQQSREETAAQLLEEQGGHFVSPYDDARIIAGASTVARELLDEVPELDMILVPVGGGGIASGTALITGELSPETRVFGCEPSGADDAALSYESGRRQTLAAPDTICDGLRASTSELTFSILHQGLAGIVRVSDETTIRAMRFLWERMKMVVEASGAIGCGALFGALEATGEDLAGRRIGVILTGGNVDLQHLPWQ